MSVFVQNQIPPCKKFVVDISQVAGTYDLCTANSGGVYIEDVVVYVASAGATLTSVSIQTNQVNPTTVMSAAEGAVANLLAEKIVALALVRPIYLEAGQKLQYTIVGLTGSGSLLVIPKYYPISSSADLV